MKKKYLFAIVPIIIAFLFYIDVALNPDWISSDGILHEQFGSKVLGSLFALIGLISSVVLIVRYFYLNKKDMN